MGKHSGVEIIDDCISKQDCEEILIALKNLNKYFWIDRSKVNPNYGIKRDVGKYFCTGSNMGLPSDLVKSLNEKAPIIDSHIASLEVNETIINHYNIGNFVPPHIDPVLETLAVCTVMLTEGNECFGYWPEGSSGPRVSIPDKIGRAIILHDMSTIHEVLPVQVERYSLIFNYF